MRRSLLGIAACALVAASSAALGADYSRIDCSDKDFLVRLRASINNMPAWKVRGRSIIDIADATTISHESTKAVCHAILTGSDGSKAAVTISLYDNSLGQPIFGMLPDPRRHSGRR